MKKLLVLLLCVPLIGYSDNDTINIIEIYIGDVEIFEDERYIQIKNDSTIIRFLDKDIVVYDTSDNGQRILEYKYIENHYSTIPWEKREWYSNGVLKYELIYNLRKFNSYISEQKYSKQGDLISERYLDDDGKEVGWWHKNSMWVIILLMVLGPPLLIIISIIAFYRIIRLFIFKDDRGLSLLLSIIILFILNLPGSYVSLIIISFVLICWIILGFFRVFNKNKPINKE